MKIDSLRVNYQENPLGIDLTHAVFSWKVKEARGKAQDWARLVVAEDAGFRKVVYDSGRADLDSCAFAPDVAWKPAKKYYWTVEVTDDAGYTTISDIATFEGGHPEGGWNGKWIRPPFSRETAPVLCQTFDLEEEELDELDTARLYLCGLGLYEVYLNGEKVGDQYLTPYYTDYRGWIQYQTYDAAGYLRAGENRIEVWMGDGWYKGNFCYVNNGQFREYYGNEFKLLADLYLTDCDGLTRVIATNENWLALPCPAVAAGIYYGEDYDAGLEAALENVSVRKQAGAPENVIPTAQEADAPAGTLCPMVGVPVRRHEVLPVKEVITSEIGETILDFGQEITGWVAFDADLPAGTQVILQYGEILQNGRFYRDNLRTARAEYHFTSSGKKQLARPHFTFYGFRYVKVTGMKVDETNQNRFQAWALYSDLAETGRLRTSSEKVNRLISNTRWSEKGNFLDIPTDCPQRDERLGWTGDGDPLDHVFPLRESGVAGRAV